MKAWVFWFVTAILLGLSLSLSIDAIRAVRDFRGRENDHAAHLEALDTCYSSAALRVQRLEGRERDNDKTEVIQQLQLLVADHQRRIDGDWDYEHMPPSPPPPTETETRKKPLPSYLGEFMGMKAYGDGTNGVVITSGQVLRWLTYQEFEDIYIKKTRPEYLPSSSLTTQ